MELPATPVLPKLTTPPELPVPPGPLQLPAPPSSAQAPHASSGTGAACATNGARDAPVPLVPLGLPSNPRCRRSCLRCQLRPQLCVPLGPLGLSSVVVRATQLRCPLSPAPLPPPRKSMVMAWSRPLEASSGVALALAALVAAAAAAADASTSVASPQEEAAVDAILDARGPTVSGGSDDGICGYPCSWPRRRQSAAGAAQSDTGIAGNCTAPAARAATAAPAAPAASSRSPSAA
jgi:hypothetical protein